jgi:hypothetical protein
MADWCSRVDPGHGQQFEHHILAALGIAKESEDILESARRDPQYRSGYELFQSVLSQDPLPDAKRACETILAQPVPNPPYNSSKGEKKNKDDPHDRKSGND